MKEKPDQTLEDQATEVRAAMFWWTVICLISFPISIYWLGFVFSALWAWFIVPLGVVAITPWHAVGITLLMLLPKSSQVAEINLRISELKSMLLDEVSSDAEADDTELEKVLLLGQQKISECYILTVSAFVAPLVAYAIGFICHRGM